MNPFDWIDDVFRIVYDKLGHKIYGDDFSRPGMSLSFYKKAVLLTLSLFTAFTAIVVVWFAIAMAIEIFTFLNSMQ